VLYLAVSIIELVAWLGLVGLAFKTAHPDRWLFGLYAAIVGIVLLYVSATAVL
jgi:hypothetical protein